MSTGMGFVFEGPWEAKAAQAAMAEATALVARNERGIGYTVRVADAARFIAQHPRILRQGMPDHRRAAVALQEALAAFIVGDLA